MARGGGSWEDLHGFDDEQVARAIAACAVPVITGIGHATDTTIADAAADVCAPTPSAAAELVTAAQHQVEARVDRLHSRLQRAGRYEMLRARQRLSRLSAEGALRSVRDALGQREQLLDELGYRAETALQRGLRARGERLMRAEARLRRHALSPLRVLERGYALVYGSDGKLLRSADAVREEDAIIAQLAKGRVRARVTGTD